MTAAAKPPRVLARLLEIPRREDFVTGAIAAAAILILVGTASRTAAAMLATLFNAGGGSDKIATIALLLNLALILFAWGRHKQARRAMIERMAAEQRVQVLRSHDAETDLLNRGALRERTSTLIDQALEHRGNVALMVVNLNQFKKVNDSYGEAVGDALLKIIAAVICANAPKDALCARLGVDEFAVALPFQNPDEARVTALAEDLLAQLSLPVEIIGVSLKVSVSIGLSHLGFDCMDFSSLLRRADIAMNAAKSDGGAAPLWFDSKMERSLRARTEVELGLKRGIPAGEFVPYFQPQIEFSTGRIHGFEMLARWNHPAGGVVEPNVFIPIAEESDAIAELSEILMRSAFEEARNWDSSLMLSVNISPKQLGDPWLAQKILKLLTETGFPAARLEVEITESSLFANLEVAQAVVTSIKSLGIKLSLDDFGTGYSSLAHLRSLPFDRIKIDRSFVLALNKDPESWTIVKSIALLGKSLGIPITLEGVESAAIELRVRELGCELGQGWFYGHAVPAAQTRRLLSENGLYRPAAGADGPDEATSGASAAKAA